ncbi:hypothetical protein CTheo_7782 [Ceratobasidium theobromae]|uniref:Uncharacterized protein n=1 Tax=Ceratobasidium theobromae TaxID=1582974 RepID=A0A5N5QAG1_9AGAM|nr:hypothetical protein CTheo_7782 [Ceratobasidium theobromae]
MLTGIRSTMEWDSRVGKMIDSVDANTMRSTVVVAVFSAVLGVFGAPPTAVDLTVSDIVRAGYHMDMAEDTVTEWDGQLYTFQPGSLPQHLFRVRGVTTSRAVPVTVGGFDILQRELFLYYKPDTDTIASTFLSPWDSQTYPVIHTQNNPVYTVLENKTYPGSTDGDRTIVSLSTTNLFTNPLNASDATRGILSPFSGGLTNISTLDTTTYTFPTSLLPQTGKPQSLTNVTISRTRVLSLLPFMNAPAKAASTTTLMMLLQGRKVAEGIDGLSTVLQTELEERKLWAYEDAPTSRDDVGSGSFKSAVNGANEWLDFATSNVFNPWRMNKTDVFPLQDIGDWCDA